MYNLKILQKNIEDDKGNVTRFLIMGKNIEQPNMIKIKNLSQVGQSKSEPLYNALEVSTNQVNLQVRKFLAKNTFDHKLLFRPRGHPEWSWAKRSRNLVFILKL